MPHRCLVSSVHNTERVTLEAPDVTHIPRTVGPGRVPAKAWFIGQKTGGHLQETMPCPPPAALRPVASPSPDGPGKQVVVPLLHLCQPRGAGEGGLGR